jgi:hypothetical protein
MLGRTNAVMHTVNIKIIENYFIYFIIIIFFNSSQTQKFKNSSFALWRKSFLLCTTKQKKKDKFKLHLRQKRAGKCLMKRK